MRCLLPEARAFIFAGIILPSLYGKKKKRLLPEYKFAAKYANLYLIWHGLQM